MGEDPFPMPQICEMYTMSIINEKGQHFNRGVIIHSNSSTTLRHVTCAIRNIVYDYMSWHRKCGSSQYVKGKGRFFTERGWLNPQHSIQHKKGKVTPVSLHFKTRRHKIYDLKAQVIECILTLDSISATTTFRKCRVKFWMLALRSLTLYGINHLNWSNS